MLGIFARNNPKSQKLINMQRRRQQQQQQQRISRAIYLVSSCEALYILPLVIRTISFLLSFSAP